MEEIRAYLLKIIVCSILCGIAVGLTARAGATGKVVKMITGICMLLTIVSPILQFRIRDIGTFLGELAADADGYVTDGENVSAAAFEDIIKTRTEAYILDKADSYGAALKVEVSLSNEQIPKPCSVRISGSISPYGKRQLQNMIREELGIALEEQIWIG